MADDEPKYTVEYIGDVAEECNWVKREGKVKVTYPNGDTFEGSFDNGKLKQGMGKYTWVKEEEEEVKEIAYYEGLYKDGKKNGLGKMKFPSGDIYHGIWVNDTMDGEGTYMYANGDIFSGIFVDGIKNGTGTYEYKNDKSQLVGTWVKGEITDGKWIFEDGGEYCGHFDNGKPIGKCLVTFHNGIQQHGEYAKTNLENEDGDPIVAYKWTGGDIVKAC